MSAREGKPKAGSAGAEPTEVERRAIDLLAASPIVLYAMEIRDGEGRGLWASAGLSRLVGWSLDEALAPGWWYANVHDDDRERVTQFYRERRGEDRLVTRYRFRHRDGTYRVVRDERLQHQRGDDGSLVAYGCWLDISDQDRAEREAQRRERELRVLLEAEPEYRLLFDANPLPMWVFDRETLRFLAVNEAAIRRYGYTREEFLERSIRDIRRPEELPRLEESLSSPKRGLDDAGLWRHVWKDGSVRQVEIFSHGIEWEDREAELVLAHDVTERMVAEEGLRDSEGRFRELVEQLNDLVFEFDLRGRLLYISPVVKALTGMSRADLKGRSVFEFCHPDDIPLVQDRVARRARGEPSIPIEFRLRRADGEYRRMRTSASEIRRRGEIVGFRGVATDITDLVVAESAARASHEQLVHGQKMEAIGRLAGGIAHDLNNLLTVIQGHGELAAGEVPPGSAAEESVREMLHAADRAGGLTRQLLAVARRQVLDERILNLNEIVEELGGMLRRVLGEDLSLSLRLAPDLRAVRADAAQLQQVVLNLAVNARDAMPGGGMLRLTTRNRKIEEDGDPALADLPAGEYVELEVRDSGEGIPPELLSRIFEPFFSTKAAGKGTGLGLSTAYGVVRQSGGTIHAENEAGGGSVFNVLLPAAGESVARAEPKSPRELAHGAAGGTESILLVEDEPALRAISRRVLEGSGYRVREAANGAEALALVEEEPGESFDLLLSDVVMPGMRGPELARRLVRVAPRMRVLFVSGYAEESLGDLAELRERSVLLAKPFSNQALLGKVREVLDQP